MIDMIQQSAIEITGLAYDLQSLAFKNADRVAKALTELRPLIRSIPIIGRAVDSEAIVAAEDLSGLIVTSAQNARKVIVDLQRALVEAKPEYLKTHLEDLKHYREEVTQMLIK
jgi:hypothetical protein